MSRRILIAIFALLAALTAGAQKAQHLGAALPGGMPGIPVITGITKTTNSVTITWDGPAGYYQLQETRNLRAPVWQAIGKQTNLIRTATVTGANSSNGFFRVAGPTPKYTGAQTCTECHPGIVGVEARTQHAMAFTNAAFVAEGGQTNASCIVCHTVGFNLPTGFVNKTKTPRLMGVQCENCHGPAANHAVNPDNPLVKPRSEVAATVCGGCHSDPRHPTFEEWKTSSHAQVVADMNGASQINACGRCHSGTARLCLLEGKTLPTGDANMGIVCITCHDPHQTNGYPAQLRYPIASTNDYFMPTNGTFASHYNAKVNVCAQCHNHAGASWTNSAAAPHHSPQYNMLLGTIGELDTGRGHYQPGSHALLITNQCVGCHMQKAAYVSDAQPAVTGHSFKVDRFDVCLKCHPFPKSLLTFAQGAVSTQIQRLKFDLDYWAANKAPAALWTKYGARAWEFTAPGELSPGGPGPNATEQKLIPENIRKARFNLYVVLSDGSFGAHNGLYTIDLINTAEEWIEDELDE